MKRVIIITLLAVIFLGTLIYLYKKSQKKPVLYETSTPFITNIVKTTIATGSVVPRKEIEVKPQQVSGIIQEIYIKPGDYIKEGDLVAKVKIIPNMIQLNNAEARVRRAKLNFDDAKKDFDRQLEIYEKGVIPLASFQKYELAYKEAKEELNSAEDNLQLIKEGATKDVKKASNTLIKSPISGMVLDIPVEIGNSVIEMNTFNAGSTIALVADMNDMIFEGMIDETEVGKLKVGMPLKLQIGAIFEKKFDAVLEYISPKGIKDQGAIQFEIIASVKLIESDFIRAGYSANAEIVLEKKDSVMAISETLLKFKNDTPYVEVEIEQQKFEKKNIEIGLSDGVDIEVLSGLEITDNLKGNKKLENKEKEEDE